jgi:hypothetical protein
MMENFQLLLEQISNSLPGLKKKIAERIRELEKEKKEHDLELSDNKQSRCLEIFRKFEDYFKNEIDGNTKKDKL